MAASKNNGGKRTLTEAQKAALDAGRGRPKGVPNKTTTLLKDAILRAAEKAGGDEGLEGYLAAQALKNPQSFLPLLGKVLPTQLTGEGGGPIQTQDVTVDAERVDTLICELAQRSERPQATLQ